MKIDIWVVGTSNQLFIRGTYTEIKFSKNKVDTGKTLLFVIVNFVLLILFVLKVHLCRFENLPKPSSSQENNMLKILH